MRTLFSTLIIAAFVVVGLSGCDFSEQNVDWEHGNSLMIVGPVDESGGDISEGQPSPEGHPVVIQPVDAFFFISGFTTEESYSWTVDGTPVSELDNASVLNDGEFLRVSFTDPGLHTIEVDNGAVSGTQTVVVQNGD